MQSVLVANPKGGCGKTTLATNLAAFLAHRKKRVVLCDLDRQQSSLRWLAFRQESLPQIEGYYGGNQLVINLPRDPDWVVMDAPAGLQGYKLNDSLNAVDRVLVPVVPSIFDMAATEDFLTALRRDLAGRGKIGIVAMRVDPRTRAAVMLEEFLKHFDLPIVAYLRTTQNYVNAAAQGGSIFDGAASRYRRDLEQWKPITRWLSP